MTQTLLVLELSHSGIALGLLTAFQFGPVLLLGAWAGAVADRSDKRRMLMTVQALAMVQSIVLGVVVLSGLASLPTVYALAAVQGVLTAFDNPARRAFVVEMVDAVGEVLAAAGLERYEISSHALPGRHSRHNALYWTGGESLALGAGAKRLPADFDGLRPVRRGYSPCSCLSRPGPGILAGRSPNWHLQK